MPMIWKGEWFDLDLGIGCNLCGFEENDNGQLCPYKITLKAAGLLDIDKEFQHQHHNQAVPILQPQATVPSRLQVRNFNRNRGGDTRPPNPPRTNQ
ncbi:hypothetical protein O181_022214 [Austropuccinia psidii MF-1]|uniref:Uncharacterized protein n=1 Tax=Austropuccinia psidii MF-1 TaxID=1389203 RepID=A0A9Q3GXG1_9BASI|nr:hypothetical protein [Austropuccinia psidii MF-1]